ncbi:hypothetical protein GGI20_003806, partial [Coemansia sp. BCRC 34301]
DVIADTIDVLSDNLRRLSLAIHDNPEVSLKEDKACRTLVDYLEMSGYKVEHGVAGLSTAFVATYVSPAGAQGLNIGFCSEYDALPGIGHGCGHNLIAISGVALFEAISKVVSVCRIPGTVRLFGTPAEEAFGGKITMLDQGVFDGTDLLMMLHPTAGYSGAWHTQCCLSMTVEYFGKASHAAMAPWDGVNAGTAANIALLTMGALREQLKPDWRTHGIIVNGGDADNVIPEYSRIKYTIRTGWAKELSILRERTLRVFEAAALATGCTHKVTEEFAYLDNLDNPVLGQLYEEMMENEYHLPPERGVGGSTDFGNLSHKFISLHSMFDLAGTRVPNHSVEFTRDARSEEAHRRTLFAAKTVARVAARCLVDEHFWSKVRQAHKERQESDKWESIPTMPIFWLSSRSRLRKAVYEAAADPSAYGKVYDIVDKQGSTLAKAFDIVLSAVESGWQTTSRQPQDQASRKSTSNSSSTHSSHSAKRLSSSTGDIKRCTDLLQVLHGVVYSFPREASRVLGDTANATRLLACVRSSAVPLDIRLAVVTLASRWCVLLRAAPQAAKHLASIVDAFYHYTGLLPSLTFLLAMPPNVRTQQGWSYPPLEATEDDLQLFMYIAPATKREQSSRHSRGASAENAYKVQANGSGGLSAEQLEKMDAHAQELTSLGGMLIDNLVTLPIDEDPQTNRVVQDMLREVNRLNSVIANHISTLTGEHTQATRRLKASTDEAKRCHWVYTDTVAAFDEWKYKRQDYATVTSNRLSKALALGGTGSSSRPLSVACVAPAVPARLQEAPNPAPLPLERVSAKARGKMPDTTPSPPPVPPQA